MLCHACRALQLRPKGQLCLLQALKSAKMYSRATNLQKIR